MRLRPGRRKPQEWIPVATGRLMYYLGHPVRIPHTATDRIGPRSHDDVEGTLVSAAISPYSSVYMEIHVAVEGRDAPFVAHLSLSERLPVLKDAEAPFTPPEPA